MLLVGVALVTQPDVFLFFKENGVPARKLSSYQLPTTNYATMATIVTVVVVVVVVIIVI